jgi:hypothetical protein
MKNLIVSLILVAFSLPTLADVSVRGRTKFGSPCYYSSTLGDFEVTYKGDLPVDTRLELDYGFALRDYNQNVRDGIVYDWAYKHVLPFEKVANGVYVARINDQTLHQRSASGRLEKLQFVVRLIAANGRVSIDNGGNSTWGYYETNGLPGPSNTCMTPDGAEFREFPLTRIQR